MKLTWVDVLAAAAVLGILSAIIAAALTGQYDLATSVGADALGFVALSLLALQVFVSGRFSGTTRAFGLRSVLTLHRVVGIRRPLYGIAFGAQEYAMRLEKLAFIVYPQYRFWGV